MKVKTFFNILFLIIVVVLGVLITRAILRPEKYKQIYISRSEEIKMRLIVIRAAQQVYRNEYKTYTGNIDTLADFVNNKMVRIIKTSGVIPENMTEDEAFNAGLIKKDVKLIPALDKILESNPNLKYENLSNFEYIPFCDGKKFDIQLETITGKTYEIPVYRIDVPLNDILANLNRSLFSKEANWIRKTFNLLFYSNLDKNPPLKSQYGSLWLGSLTDAGTSGSWE